MHPLSGNQRLIWQMQRLLPGNPVYGQAIAWRILSEFDVHALRRTCQWLVDRHAALRTTYGVRAGQPVQIVHDRQAVSFRIHDARDWDEDELQVRFDREVYRVFDLETGPLMRVHLFMRTPGQHRLLLSFHHIAADFYSLMLILQDIRAWYPLACRGEEPPPSPLATYADFVRWQTAFLEGAEGDRQWQFWRANATAPVEVLRMPADDPRPAVTSYAGMTHQFTVQDDLTSRLRSLAPSISATMNAVLLGGFQALLHRWCGQSRFSIRTIVSGRSEPDFAHVVGHFANAVPLYADFSDDPAFTTVVDRTRQSVTAAIEHQDFPIAVLAERLGSAGHAIESQASDAMFRLQIPHRFRTELREQRMPEGPGTSVVQARGTRLDFGSLVAELFNPIHSVAYHGIDLEFVEAGGALSGYLHYRPEMFRAATITRLAEEYVRLLASAVEDPGRRVSALDAGHTSAAVPRARPVDESGSRAQTHCWGVRVDVRDVEAALREHPGVHDAMVAPSGTERSVTRLIAYVVADNPSSVERELRRHLEERIPRYLVPAVFVFRSVLPRGLDGGPDRAALSDPGELTSALDAECRKSRTPTEERVARIWRSLFGLDALSLHDNFFALGGHSLLAAHMSVLLCAEFGQGLPLSLLLASPTVAELAAHIDLARVAGAESQSTTGTPTACLPE